MFRIILMRLLPSVIMAILFGIIGEVVVRSAGLSKGWNSIQALKAAELHNPFPPYSLGFTYAADTSFYNIRGELYNTNSDGFRDHPHSKKKPAGKKRLLLIGDSVTEGIGVMAADRFSDKLELPAYEVFNMGIARYNTFDALEVMQQYAISYSPDHILLQVCENDVASKTGKGQPPADKSFFQAKSALYLYLAEKYNAAKLIMGGKNVLTQNLDAKTDVAFEAAFGNIERINYICKEMQIGMSLMYVPIHAEVLMQNESQADKMNKRFRDFSIENGINYIDVLGALRGNSFEDLYIDHGHLSPLGHAIVGTQIQEQLSSRLQ